MKLDRFQPPGTIEHLRHERDSEPRLCPDCNQWEHKCTCKSESIETLGTIAHVEKLIQLGVNSFAQGAIGFAIQTALVTLTYDFEKDSHLIMDKYDEICDAYQQALRRELEQEQEAAA